MPPPPGGGRRRLCGHRLNLQAVSVPFRPARRLVPQSRRGPLKIGITAEMKTEQDDRLERRDFLSQPTQRATATRNRRAGGEPDARSNPSPRVASVRSPLLLHRAQTAVHPRPHQSDAHSRGWIPARQSASLLGHRKSRATVCSAGSG